MKNLTSYELNKLLKCFHNTYYCCYNTKIKSHNKMYWCTVFKLLNPLTDEQKDIINSFPNAIVGNTIIPQRPHCVFLTDTKFID